MTFHVEDAELIKDPRAGELAREIREESWFPILMATGNPAMKRLAAQITINAIRDAIYPGRTVEGLRERSRLSKRKRAANMTEEDRERQRAACRAYYHRTKAKGMR